MATEAEETEGLDRVLIRLAMTEEDKLEKVNLAYICIICTQMKFMHWS